jgi:hypothetical protein
VYGDFDTFTVTRQGFINGVVDYLKYHVMQAGPIIGIADIHTWPFAYGIQAFQDLDIRRIVAVFAH